MLAPTRRAAIVGRGSRFCGGRRLQVVVGELGGAVDGDGAGVGLDQVAQGPGTGREGVRQAGQPRKASFTVRGNKGTVAREGFNAPPFVSAFHTRRELPAWGRGIWRIKRRLLQHGATAQDAPAGGIADLAAIILDGGNLRTDALDEFTMGADTSLGWHAHL